MDKDSTWHWKWEDMCGPEGLVPWNDVTKDIGLCFQLIYFDVPVLFLIASFSGYYVGYRKDWVIRGKLQETAIQFRSLIVLCLAFIPVVDLYVVVTNVGYTLYPVDYLVAGCSCLTWLVHFGYVLALKHRLGMSPRGPVVLLVWWTAAAMLTAVSLRSRLLAVEPIAFNIASMVCHALYFLSLLPSEGQSSPTYYSPCLVGSQYSQFSELLPLLHQGEEGVLGTAMQGVSFPSKLLFCWVEPLFLRGIQKKLKDPDELFDLPLEYRCGYIGHRVDRALIGNVDKYQEYEERPIQPFMHSGYGAVEQSTPSSSQLPSVLVRSPRRHNVTLLRALHTCFGWHFYAIGALKFIADAAGFAGPMLLNKLVTFVEDKTIDMHMGYLYAGGLLLSTLVAALCGTHFSMQMSLIGLKMRAAIVSTILRKTLSVSSTELNKSFTIGEITNFMSTDTDRIVNSCPSFHALWSIPLQLFVSLYLLYRQVGIAFLAGVAFTALLIPVNRWVANHIGRLSTELMRHKDARVSRISELLRGIRTIKLHVWEDYFIEKVSDDRQQELKYLQARKYLDALCVVFWATTPVLMSVLTLTTYVLLGNALDAPTVFTAVALMNMLIAPLNAFPWVLNGLTEAWVSIKRIQNLLKLPDMDEEQYYDKINTNRDEENILIFKNAQFSWAKASDRVVPPKSRKNKGKSKKRQSQVQENESESTVSGAAVNKPFTLSALNLEVRRGQLIAIVGRVGSGKSSLLHAIIAEMIKQDGELRILDNLDGFGYVSQKPWLQRGTIRDNILFGKPYDETKFKTVVDACGLTVDLNALGWGYAVGEGGCTLSGGQRARVALARAVYQNKQVYLLDDVFSGVDSRVASHIFRACVLGLLRNKTRVLVTHSPTLLALADRVVFMRDGTIRKQGPPDAVLQELEDYSQSENEWSCEEPARPGPEADDSLGEDQSNLSVNSLLNEETMSSGSVGWWVLGMYLRSVGVALAIMVLLSLLLMQVSQNITFLWLSYWVSSAKNNNTSLSQGLDTLPLDNFTLFDHGIGFVDNTVHNILTMVENLLQKEKTIKVNQTQAVPRQLAEETNSTTADAGYYLSIYIGLAGLNLAFTVIRAFLFAYGGVQAATKIHRSLLKVIIKAKVSFFDRTPIGRILNRFSSDTYTVDDSLPFILNILLAQICGLFGALAVTVYGLPWLVVVLVPMLPVYYWLQHRYRLTSRELKRLHSVTLSPIYSHFNDTLEGMTTIRAFHATVRTQECAEELVDLSMRASLASACAAQWLGLRLQFMGVAVITGAAAVAVVQRQFTVADAGLVGLAISYALSVTSLLGGVMNAFPETEREMIAVERVGEYIRQVHCERSAALAAPPYGWPSQGVVSFNNVVLKYRDNSPAALNGVSFETRPAEKLGVVGRTGAGKSSLFAALLRLSELHSGSILVDSVDTSLLGLAALRSRIAVIPQEPFIFAGTIRENVDPLHQYIDSEIWVAIDKCGAREAISARGGLSGAASDLSRGYMQLLCLARAILQSAKILCIDEATANVDHETDRLIQETIRCSFHKSTVITIAHRISTVMDCERVLVMGEGRVLELDAPDDLLQDPQSHFYQLVNGESIHWRAK